MHAVIVPGRTLSQAASPSPTESSQGPIGVLYPLVSRALPPLSAEELSCQGLASWNSCLQPEGWGQLEAGIQQLIVIPRGTLIDGGISGFHSPRLNGTSSIAAG